MDDDQPLPNSLDEEAEQFYKTIKEIQPEGPYRIFGFSYGVTLAWKVAELCIKNDDTIELLELMDGFPPEVLKRMPAQAHTRLLFSMIQFVIKILNKKPYGESFNLPLITQQAAFEHLLPKMANTIIPDTKTLSTLVTRAIDVDLFDKHNLIAYVFALLQRQLKNPKSLRIVQLAERHLNFMLNQPEPSQLLSIRAIVYQTNEMQDYWKMMESIPALIKRAPDRRFLFWNHYFLNVRKNGRKIDLDHLELLMKSSPARQTSPQSFWAKKHDRLFNIIDSFGPNAFYTCEHLQEAYCYYFHFFPNKVETCIKSQLKRMQLEFQELPYQMTSELTQEDAASHAMQNYRIIVPPAKKNQMDNWLVALKWRKKEIEPVSTKTISFDASVHTLYLTVMWIEQPLLDFSFNLRLNSSFKQLTIPNDLFLVKIPHKPGIIYLALCYAEIEVTIFDAIEQCSRSLSQFIASLNDALSLANELHKPSVGPSSP